MQRGLSAITELLVTFIFAAIYSSVCRNFR